MLATQTLVVSRPASEVLERQCASATPVDAPSLGHPGKVASYKLASPSMPATVRARAKEALPKYEHLLPLSPADWVKTSTDVIRKEKMYWASALNEHDDLYGDDEDAAHPNYDYAVQDHCDIWRVFIRIDPLAYAQRAYPKQLRINPEEEKFSETSRLRNLANLRYIPKSEFSVPQATERYRSELSSVDAKTELILIVMELLAVGGIEPNDFLDVCCTAK